MTHEGESVTVRATDEDGDEAIREMIEAQLDDPEILPGRALALRALRRVNQIRRVFDAPPLRDLRRGVVGDSSDCPIARSLRMDGVEPYVDGERVRFDNITQAELVVAELNENLTQGTNAFGEAAHVHGFEEFDQFVEAFDHGDELASYRVTE